MKRIGFAALAILLLVTLAFAGRTGRRLGTAVMVERIIPVVYSPVISRTPSTPIARTPNCTPIRLVFRGSKVAFWTALIVAHCDAFTADAMIPNPIVITIAASSE